MAATVIRNADDGENLWFAGGGVLTLKLSAEETGGALFMIEDHVVRGKTTPLHRHQNEDELIYVAHSFLVTSEAAHLLSVETPGTGERFYRDASDPVTSATADAARPPDLTRLREVAARTNSVELLGPPPFTARQP